MNDHVRSLILFGRLWGLRLCLHMACGPCQGSQALPDRNGRAGGKPATRQSDGEIGKDKGAGCFYAAAQDPQLSLIVRSSKPPSLHALCWSIVGEMAAIAVWTFAQPAG
jgi:hypothetical protein